MRYQWQKSVAIPLLTCLVAVFVVLLNRSVINHGRRAETDVDSRTETARIAALQSWQQHWDAGKRRLEEASVQMDSWLNDWTKISVAALIFEESSDRLELQLNNWAGIWNYLQNFLSNDRLNINVKLVKGNWEDAGDPGGGRDKRRDCFDISMVNRGSETLTNLYVEFCTYRDRKDLIATYNTTIEIGDLAPGKDFDARRYAVSFRRDNFLNETIGARFRFMMPTDSGRVLVREPCVPQPLPLDQYPWVEGERERQNEKASLPQPTEYLEIGMTQPDVRDLAEQYINAWKNDDFTGWKALLSPMHPGDSTLSPTRFQMLRKNISTIQVLAVDGMNVQVRIFYKNGHHRDDWLLIHSSGHIKYTPLAFQHPVKKGLDGVAFLLRESREDLRITGMAWLNQAGAPHFDYDIHADMGNWERNTERIMEWFRENGASHDINEPKVFFPEEALQECITQTESQLQQVPMYNKQGI